jgi:hypothetical protein
VISPSNRQHRASGKRAKSLRAQSQNRQHRASGKRAKSLRAQSQNRQHRASGKRAKSPESPISKRKAYPSNASGEGKWIGIWTGKDRRLPEVSSVGSMAIRLQRKVSCVRVRVRGADDETGSFMQVSWGGLNSFDHYSQARLAHGSRLSELRNPFTIRKWTNSYSDVCDENPRRGSQLGTSDQGVIGERL